MPGAVFLHEGEGVGLLLGAEQADVGGGAVVVDQLGLGELEGGRDIDDLQHLGGLDAAAAADLVGGLGGGLLEAHGLLDQVDLVQGGLGKGGKLHVDLVRELTSASERDLAAAEAAVRDLHLDNEQLRMEERQAAERQLLTVQKAALLDARHAGVVSEEAFAHLANEIDGAIDAIVSDHAPSALTEKEGLFEEAVPGAVGLETTLAVVLGLCAAGHLPLARAIDALTLAPARAFGLDAGTLAIGGAADLCVVDPTRAWTVGAAELVGKSKHTPLTGQRMVGRAVLTLFAGAVTCDRDERLA